MPGNFRRFACALAAALIAGCATLKVGRDFDYNAFASRVQLGTTTAAEVMNWLGAPAGKGVEVGTDRTRLDVWNYYYGTGKLPSGSNTSFKLLQVKIDEQGKVAAYVWTGDMAGAPVEDKSSAK
jgi:hypothetical protein